MEDPTFELLDINNMILKDTEGKIEDKERILHDLVHIIYLKQRKAEYEALQLIGAEEAKLSAKKKPDSQGKTRPSTPPKDLSDTSSNSSQESNSSGRKSPPKKPSSPKKSIFKFSFKKKPKSEKCTVSEDSLKRINEEGTEVEISSNTKDKKSSEVCPFIDLDLQRKIQLTEGEILNLNDTYNDKYQELCNFYEQREHLVGVRDKMVDYMVSLGVGVIGRGEQDGKMDRCKFILKELDQISHKISSVSKAIEDYREINFILNSVFREILKITLIYYKQVRESPNPTLHIEKTPSKKKRSKSFDVGERRLGMISEDWAFKRPTSDVSEDTKSNIEIFRLINCAKLNLERAKKILPEGGVYPGVTSQDTGLVIEGSRTLVSFSEALSNSPLNFSTPSSNIGSILTSSRQHIIKCIRHADKVRSNWDVLERGKLKEVMKMKKTQLDSLMEKPWSGIKKARQRDY
eukprot:TRINITY_DN1748_c0_g1_i2.p1 TRINITY_DN1748_c0_g1~~TRINITY_DN1748_c0_g1_i2.p1  ORF type:complete len:461 (-),score=100.40 TRINITY_DN1748_c0_g1_i2:111-1493(-)